MNRYRMTVDPNSPTGIELRGGNEELFFCHDPQVILSGPADTGKTVTCCTKLHWLCQRYPGSQHAMVRKTFTSLAGTACKTFERIIAGASVKKIGADSPRLYTYPNGSQVWVGGMDKPEKTLSSERDSIYVCQAEELSESDWEMLSRASSGRGAKVKYPQLFGDCNPGGSKHWIRERWKAGKLTLIGTKHHDNPTLYHKNGDCVRDGETVNGMRVVIGGEKRVHALSELTGVRRKRLFEGLWVTAEGAVYDMFDAQLHVVTRSVAEMKLFRLALDEGYTNPAVILIVGEDSDGRWHVFKEFYERGQLQETVVKQAKEWHQDPVGAVLGIKFVPTPSKPYPTQSSTVAVDEAAAGLIADLVAIGVPAVGGKGRVLDGINHLQNRLKLAGDGRPRLTFDPSCVNCINEFESYVWTPDKPKDTPVKEHDHTSDALRYLYDVLAEPDGSMTGPDQLWTKNREDGYGRVTEVRQPVDSFRL